jgi:small conductance mechanosensitive channel
MPRYWHRTLACLLVMAGALGPMSANGANESASSSPPPKVETTIAVGSDSSTDAKIKSRLEQLFASLDGLQGVQVEVSAGVVELSGEVSTSAAHDHTLRLTRRIENVVEVRDRITESRDLRKRLSLMLERVLAQLVNFVTYLPLLIVAGAVLAFFWWIAKRAAGSDRLTRRFSRNPFMRDLARQVVRVLIVGVGLLLALEVLDASTLVGSVLGAAGVVGLAVGFALRDAVENYIASLLLSLRQPFSRDDLVTIEGCEGRVLRLTPRATILMTPDGNHTRIPNAKVYKAVIVNYTRNPKRRFQFDVGIDTEQNLPAAQQLAATTLAQMDGVLHDPPPTCTVEQLGESNVILRVFGWVDQMDAEFLKVRSEAIRLVKGAFDRAGVVMPEPIYNVRVGQLPASARSPAGSLPPADRTPVEGTRPSRKKPEPEDSAEPQRAIDIARRDDLDGQIAADRSANEEDLLHPQAAKE